jgi:Mycobacteriophage tail assembly protein
MPSITLSDIQQAADKKFGDFEIHLPSGDIVSFAPALRLPKESRRKLAVALDVEKRAEVDNDDDLYDVYKDIFRISQRQADGFDKLAAAVGDDPAVWDELTEEFMKDSQAGEA